jgi:hypothetical protein
MEILYPLIAATSMPTRTLPGDFFENRGCELVLQITYPPNCPFYVHDPEFDGNITLGASDAFDAFSFFGP